MAANTVFSTDIVNGEVKTADIGGGEVGTSDIANDAVSGAKVLDDTLGNVDLKSGSVRATEVANGTLTGDDIQNGSIGPQDTVNLARSRSQSMCSAERALAHPRPPRRRHAGSTCTPDQWCERRCRSSARYASIVRSRPSSRGTSAS